MVNFGTFGADNYIQLGDILFSPRKEKMTCGKMTKIIVSTLLGIGSRLPGAGITLKLAPGIPKNLRLPLAAVNILGTCSPETLSMYNTLGMNIQQLRQCCNKNQRHATLHRIRENILKCLLGAKERILLMSPQEREKELNNIEKELLFLKTKPVHTVALKIIFDCFLTKESHEKATKIEKTHQSRKWIKIGIGTFTSLGTVCSLAQGTLLSKQTFDYLISSAPVWTWVPSILSSLTIAHTTFDSSYKAAYKTFDMFSGLWNNKQSHTVSSTLYPKTDVCLHLMAIFWSLALFGILYESAAGTTDMGWGGITLFSGNYMASVFLIFQVMMSIMDKGVNTYAQSKFAKDTELKTAKMVQALEELQKLIVTCPLEDFRKTLGKMTFTEEQVALLMDGVESNNIHTTFKDLFNEEEEEVLESTPLLINSSMKN